MTDGRNAILSNHRAAHTNANPMSLELASAQSFTVIMFSNMVPLVSAEFEYHAKWCALKSPSMREYVVVIRWSIEGRYPPVQEVAGACRYW